MNGIANLYPQYHYNTERRQNNIPVAIDRRNGQDRRNSERVILDNQLTKDIYQIKSQIAKFENNMSTQFNTFTQRNNLNQDLFIKSSKPDNSELLRQESKYKEKSDSSIKMGILAAALAGCAAVSFLGAAGTVIAIGSIAYIGSKMLKNVFANEIKDNSTKSK